MAGLVGQTVSHYTILEHLGGGGMGVVYKARDLRLDRIVALKFLPPEFTRDPEAKRRFLQEAKAASTLQHDNICTIHDIDENAAGELFMCMDFYDGETLKKRIERGSLPAEEAIDLVLQVSRGLAAAHTAGMMHRDIKPANIIVTKGGEAKIVDFGLAKLARQTRLTRAGSTLGTVAYMSPEQASGEEVDQRSDIWSLGAVLHEMLTGKPPFSSDYEQALVYAILNEDIPPLEGVDARLEHVVRKALSKKPSERYQQTEELSSALALLQKEYGTAGPRIGHRRRRRLLKWIGGAGALLVLLAGISGILTWFINPPPETGDTPPVRRMVVLPFENLGPQENEYFADGMTEELTSRLSGLRALRVISRTSAAQYLKTDKSMDQIGSELGVDYALEGTVRWAPSEGRGSRVRISSSLTRISDKTTLWAETYDRVMDDIFALQSEISQRVIEKLGVTLLDPERQAIEVPPTTNLDAYQAFLRARHFRNRPHYTAGNWALAIEGYEQAVSLEPDFALAWAELARAHGRFYHLWDDHSDERLQMATRAAQRARTLAPESPAVHLALGYYHLYTSRDPKKAFEDFAVAERGFPHHIEILEAKTTVFSMEGRWTDALESAREACAVSPRDGSLATDLGEIYWVLRRYEEAFRVLNSAIELTPDDAWPYLFKVFTLWSWKGGYTETRSILQAVPTSHDWAPLVWYWQNLFERNYRNTIEGLASTPEAWIRTKCWAMPKALLSGYAAKLAGDRKESQKFYESAKSLLESEVARHPDDPRYRSSLGIAYAALGRNEEAIREGKKAVDLLPLGKDAFYGIPPIQDLAFIYTLTGETAAAVERLDFLLTIPSWMSPQWLGMDPHWDLLRSDPGFVRILEKHSRDN